MQSVLDGVRHDATDILPCLGREVGRMRGNRFEYGLDLWRGKRRDGLVAECGSQVLAHDKLRLPVGSSAHIRSSIAEQPGFVVV